MKISSTLLEWCLNFGSGVSPGNRPSLQKNRSTLATWALAKWVPITPVTIWFMVLNNPEFIGSTKKLTPFSPPCSYCRGLSHFFWHAACWELGQPKLSTINQLFGRFRTSSQGWSCAVVAQLWAVRAKGVLKKKKPTSTAWLHGKEATSFAREAPLDEENRKFRLELQHQYWILLDLFRHYHPRIKPGWNILCSSRIFPFTPPFEKGSSCRDGTDFIPRVPEKGRCSTRFGWLLRLMMLDFSMSYNPPKLSHINYYHITYQDNYPITPL